MRRSFFSFFFMSLMFLVFYSCSSNKKQPEFTPLYNAHDTLEVHNMTDVYFRYLIDQDFEAALDMLSEVKNDTIRPLLPETRENTKILFEQFPVLEYSKILEEWEDVDPIIISYSITFAKSEDNIPFTTKMTLQPIRVDGRWYLMLYKAL